MANPDGRYGGRGETIVSSRALRAYRELLDLKRGGSAVIGAEAAIFALSWLAAGRLLVMGKVAGFTRYDDMLKRDFWMASVRAGVPEESLPVVWGSPVELREGDSVHHDALRITQSLLAEDPEGDWVLFDSIWDFAESKLTGKSAASYAYDPSLCDLLFDLLGKPADGTVWLPFDYSGQLAVRAIRRGLTPLAFGPGWNGPNTVARLLLLMESRSLHAVAPQFEIAKDGGDHRPIVKSDFLIACPPPGAKVIPGMGWKKWEASPLDALASCPIYQKHAGRYFLQLDRADSWALAAFWPAVARRAVFMTLPNVLFAKGQEQRLRESLLGGSNVAAVIALPGRLVQGTGVVTALTVMDRAHHGRSVRMVDATECMVETKSTMRFSRILDASRVSHLFFEAKTEEGLSTDVPYKQIAVQDFNLVPSRYLKQVDAADQARRVPLGQLVEAVRAPVASKDDGAVAVGEVGIPALDRWQPIVGPFEKSTSVQPRKLLECAVRDGDILVSIKGTIGKTGLIGTDAAGPGIPAVSSQSCVVLRVTSERITPLQLFLYLRSDDFRRQAEALKVGVSVAHVTPATLLQDVKVPVSALLELGSARERYAELCDLENGVDVARRRMKEIQAGL